MSDELRARVLEEVSKMLADPRCEVVFEAGTVDATPPFAVARSVIHDGSRTLTVRTPPTAEQLNRAALARNVLPPREPKP